MTSGLKGSVIALAAMIGVGLASTAANANVVTLTFEGLGDQQQIGNYYNGGGGGNYGISFGTGSLAVISSADGGSGAFSNAPSGDTIAFFFSGPGDVMNVSGGFTTGFSFYYADQVGFTGNVSVYSGANGTGLLLASLSLPSTPSPYTVFVPVGVSFAGLADSVVFGGAASLIGFDNITLGAATPVGVPEPLSMALLGTGLMGLGIVRRRRG